MSRIVHIFKVHHHDILSKQNTLSNNSYRATVTCQSVACNSKAPKMCQTFEKGAPKVDKLVRIPALPLIRFDKRVLRTSYCAHDFRGRWSVMTRPGYINLINMFNMLMFNLFNMFNMLMFSRFNPQHSTMVWYTQARFQGPRRAGVMRYTV